MTMFASLSNSNFNKPGFLIISNSSRPLTVDHNSFPSLATLCPKLDTNYHMGNLLWNGLVKPNSEEMEAVKSCSIVASKTKLSSNDHPSSDHSSIHIDELESFANRVWSQGEPVREETTTHEDQSRTTGDVSSYLCDEGRTESMYAAQIRNHIKSLYSNFTSNQDIPSPMVNSIITTPLLTQKQNEISSEWTPWIEKYQEIVNHQQIQELLQLQQIEYQQKQLSLELLKINQLQNILSVSQTQETSSNTDLCLIGELNKRKRTQSFDTENDKENCKRKKPSKFNQKESLDEYQGRQLEFENHYTAALQTLRLKMVQSHYTRQLLHVISNQQ